MAEPRIVLYGHAGCPGSQAARGYFWEHKIAYEARDIGADAGARAEFTAAGGFATPLILVGGHKLPGFDPGEFERLLLSVRGARR